MTVFAVGQPCPIPFADGLQLSGSAPVMVVIGIEDPTQQEINSIQRGRIVHRFGVNDQTAWMTLHFYDRSNRCIFMGEVFYCGGASPEDFTDEKLIELREKLPKGIGIGCTIILVDTVSKLVRAMRMYAWSNALSHAFLDAAEATRGVDQKGAYDASTKLMLNTTDQLATMASISFDLPGG